MEWDEWVQDSATRYWLEHLDWLRSNHYLIWMILTTLEPLGSDTMAQRLGWPLDYVIWRLRRYKREGLIVDLEAKNRRVLVWTIAEGARFNMEWDLEELLEWWLERRRQVDLDLERRGQ